MPPGKRLWLSERFLLKACSSGEPDRRVPDAPPQRGKACEGRNPASPVWGPHGRRREPHLHAAGEGAGLRAAGPTARLTPGKVFTDPRPFKECLAKQQVL